MKGDFSRIRFNPRNQYTSVLQQQGRVGLDADANEQCAINEYIRDTEATDVVGPYGGPRGDEGFAITVSGNQMLIGPGRYYVHGILCENEPTALPYTEQHFLIDPTPTDVELLVQLSTGTITVIQVYLEVWQRLVTALDDPCLREPALGQADTTARLQTVWRVVARGIAAAQPAPSIGPARTFELSARRDTLRKPGLAAVPETPIIGGVRGSRLPIIPLPPIRFPQPQPIPDPSHAPGDCCADMYQPVPQAGTPGRLSAQTSDTSAPCSCEPTPPAGYRGLENQLYRVEIHKADDENSVTFKWSRENGSVVVAVTGVAGRQVIVDSLGPDANLGFAAGQWVEIIDDTELFGSIPNQPGNLYQIQTITPEQRTMTMTEVVAAVDLTKNPRLRRWDQFGSSASSNGVALSVGSWLDLENGIQVQFAQGQYRSGDHWLIPARTATGQIEWPPCDSDGSSFQPAHRADIYKAPLACIQWDATQNGVVVHDCRKSFFPLTELTPTATAPAFHVSKISWRNDDIMTLDQLLLRPLSGTVSVTAGSPTVTGTGTSFTTELTPGQWLLFATGEPLYQISAIVSDAQLTLVSNYGGDTDKSTTALVSGLTVALDQPAPASQFLTATNFIVSLEVAVPIPVRTSNEMLNAIAILPEPISTSIMPLFRTTAVAVGADTSPRIEVAGGTAGISMLALALENMVSVIRFELLLDGYLTSGGSALAWLPFLSLRRGALPFELINALLSLGAAQGVFSRVRVKLLGRTLFTVDGNGNQIFLDGQSFGMAGSTPRVDGSARIDLQLPSGNNEKASDFESWFYLTPILTITKLQVDPNTVTLNRSETSSVVTGTVILNYSPSADTLVTLSVTPPPNVPSAVTVPSGVIVPKNKTLQTFTISVNNTGTSQTQTFEIDASLPPALGITRKQAASLSVTGFWVIF